MLVSAPDSVIGLMTVLGLRVVVEVVASVVVEFFLWVSKESFLLKRVFLLFSPAFLKILPLERKMESSSNLRLLQISTGTLLSTCIVVVGYIML